jgi:predicted PurR-regulated permease PerM
VTEPTRGPLLSSPAVTRTARWGIAAWSLIGVAVLGYLAYRYVLYPIRVIFPPLLVALIIVFLLNPLVSRLERRGFPRFAGTMLTYVVFLTAMGFLLAWLVPMVSEQVAGFDKQAPKLFDRATEWLADIGNRIGFDVQPDQLLSSGGEQQAIDFFGRIASFTAGVLHVVLIMVLGPILAFYLLVDLPKIRRGIQAMIPVRRRAETRIIGDRLTTAVGGFFRGQFLVALFVALASMGALWLVGLPYWALIGLLTGLFNLIPLIGPFIGGALAILVAMTSTEATHGIFDLTPGWLAFWAAMGLLVVQQIDNHIISPNVVARTVKLHPVTVMLSLLAGGSLLGLWGMLLAVPVVASVKVLILYYWDTRSSWPPDARAVPPPVEESIEAEANVAAMESAEKAKPEQPVEGEPEVAREGATGHWWWRWRSRFSRRTREEQPAGKPRS